MGTLIRSGLTGTVYESSNLRTEPSCRARSATPRVPTNPTRSSTTPAHGSARVRNPSRNAFTKPTRTSTPRVASGNQECALCADIVGASYKYGESYWDICSPVGASADMRPMCIAQMKTLQACPEFTNGWCYQDMGGTQQLRAPCPPHLICHYCLGLNPLHC